MKTLRALLLRRRARLVLIVPFAALLYGPSPALAVTLGTAQSFAVLGGQSVTNTDAPGPIATTITGDVGVSPGTSITGGPPTMVLTGSSVVATPTVAAAAHADALIAFNALAALPFTTDLSGTNLGGLNLNAGVYNFSSSAGLTGTLNLNFALPNQSFVFQTESTLITASGSSVTVSGAGANTGSVYWEVGISATLGSGSTFLGNIIALTTIAFDPTAAISCGRAIALNGSVTMIGNTISNDCANGSGGFTGGSGGGVGATPLPAALPLYLTGLGVMGLLGWRRKRKGSAAIAAAVLREVGPFEAKSRT